MTASHAAKPRDQEDAAERAEPSETSPDSESAHDHGVEARRQSGEEQGLK